MDDKKTPSPEFISEQYSQYWEMKRFHLSLSWQIPALAAAAIVGFFTVDPDSLRNWHDAPFIPSLAFLLLSLFIVLMRVHHKRNIVLADVFEEAVKNLESQYGVPGNVYHNDLQRDAKKLKGLSSSRALDIFLGVLGAVLFAASAYYFIQWIQ